MTSQFTFLNGSGSGTTADLSEKGVYYFRVENPGDFTATISAEQIDHTEIVIQPMMPVKIPDDSPFRDSDMLSQVLAMIKRLSVYTTTRASQSANMRNVVFFIAPDGLEGSDTSEMFYDGKDMFNYLYQPPEDRMILNPLRSSSFNNINHFYNQFTICKVQTYDALGDSNIFISQ